MEHIGLIAGNGTFPILFARTAREEGVRVVAVAHEGETPPELTDHVDAITWIKVGQLDTIIRTFQAHGVRRAVMAGGIRKAALMEQFAPDERAQRFLARLSQWSDDTLLRGVAGSDPSLGRDVEDLLAADREADEADFLSPITRPLDGAGPAPDGLDPAGGGDMVGRRIGPYRVSSSVSWVV